MEGFCEGGSWVFCRPTPVFTPCLWRGGGPTDTVDGLDPFVCAAVAAVELFPDSSSCGGSVSIT